MKLPFEPFRQPWNLWLWPLLASGLVALWPDCWVISGLGELGGFAAGLASGGAWFGLVGGALWLAFGSVVLGLCDGYA